jgi:hypothetical protein
MFVELVLVEKRDVLTSVSVCCFLGFSVTVSDRFSQKMYVIDAAVLLQTYTSSVLV